MFSIYEFNVYAVACKCYYKKIKINKIHEVERKVRQPGIEPGSTAWKATMLTFTPPTLLGFSGDFNRPVANNSLNIDMLGSTLFHLTE